MGNRNHTPDTHTQQREAERERHMFPKHENEKNAFKYIWKFYYLKT